MVTVITKLHRSHLFRRLCYAPLYCVQAMEGRARVKQGMHSSIVTSNALTAFQLKMPWSMGEWRNTFTAATFLPNPAFPRPTTGSSLHP